LHYAIAVFVNAGNYRSPYVWRAQHAANEENMQIILSIKK